MLRRDRPHSNEVETLLDVEVEEEIATGSNHRLYLRVMGAGGPTGCVIEADVPAHPYDVMGIASTPSWRIALTLEQAVAIPL